MMVRQSKNVFIRDVVVIILQALSSKLQSCPRISVFCRICCRLVEDGEILLSCPLGIYAHSFPLPGFLRCVPRCICMHIQNLIKVNYV